jgi:DHA1 family bicyclomycin/chloramphenicol resistance-like MFS transporter
VTPPDRAAHPAARRIQLALSDRALILLLAPLTALGAMSQNMFVPVLPLLRAELGLTIAQANTTGSFALASFAFGLLFGGMLSDRLGRRPVMLVGNCVFVLGSIGCALAPSLGWLVTARIVQALGSSVCMVTTRAIIGDVYPRESMARMLAFLTMVMVIAPSLSPIVGGFIGDLSGWRGVFWVLAGVGLPSLILTAWRLPETRSDTDRAAFAANGGDGPGALWRQSRHILGDLAFFNGILQAAVIYATFLVFVWSTPYVLKAQGLPLSTYGLWNLLIAVGYFIGNWLVTRRSGRHSMAGFIRTGVTLQLAGAVLAFALAEAAFAGPLLTPLCLFLPMAIIAYGQGQALPNVTASAVALHPEASGTASSLMGFGQQFAAAVAVQFMGLFPATTAQPTMRFILAAAVFSAVLLWFDQRRQPKTH